MTRCPHDLTALVPVRANGKTRLADALDRDDRRALVAAMLVDVLAALRAAEVGRVCVIADGAEAARLAGEAGAETVRDEPPAAGLDRAVAHALDVVAPAGDSLVVAADLPMLGADDVAALCAVPADVAVAPTRDGGTGALLRPPGGMRTAYGEASASSHLRLAARAGLTAAPLHRVGLAHDVDTADDLARLDPERLGPETAALLPRLGSRLRAAG